MQQPPYGFVISAYVNLMLDPVARADFAARLCTALKRIPVANHGPCEIGSAARTTVLSYRFRKIHDYIFSRSVVGGLAAASSWKLAATIRSLIAT